MIDKNTIWTDGEGQQYKIVQIANSQAKDREQFPVIVVFVDCKTMACYACSIEAWEKNFKRVPS